eukprot:5117139-Pleurochrysis_carterae.AAC.4
MDLNKTVTQKQAQELRRQVKIANGEAQQAKENRREQAPRRSWRSVRLHKCKKKVHENEKELELSSINSFRELRQRDITIEEAADGADVALQFIVEEHASALGAAEDCIREEKALLQLAADGAQQDRGPRPKRRPREEFDMLSAKQRAALCALS